MRRLGILCIAAAIGACAGGGQNIIGPELFTYTGTSQVTSTNPMRFQTTVTIKNPTPGRSASLGEPRLLEFPAL